MLNLKLVVSQRAASAELAARTYSNNLRGFAAVTARRFHCTHDVHSIDDLCHRKHVGLLCSGWACGQPIMWRVEAGALPRRVVKPQPVRAAAQRCRRAVTERPCQVSGCRADEA
jgi:hypothetical protein